MNNSFEAEQSILGGLMLLSDPNTELFQKVLSRVKDSSFYARQHSIIYQAIKRIAASGQVIDMISVDAKLQQMGESDNVGGFAYLADLIRGTPSAANIMGYVEILREQAITRVANSKLQEAIATLNENNGSTIYEKLGLVESYLSEVLTRATSGKEAGLVHVSEVGEKWAADLDARFSGNGLVEGYETGIESLDKILYPKLVRNGSLVVVGARPKMGKTAFLNRIIGQFALHHKKAVATFSLEMPSDQILERMLVERANVNPDILYRGAEDQADLSKVSAAMGEYIESNLYLDDTPGITIQHVQREARKLAKNKDLGLIAIDYLTLMEGEKADRNDLAYGKITKALKNLAKELNCIVVLLTQLNRSLETRSDKRPMPSDSRDTGQIEQDCDLWIGLYREGVYKELPKEQAGLTEAIIRLNRHGSTGTGYLNLKHGYFVDAQPFSFEKKVDDNY